MSEYYIYFDTVINPGKVEAIKVTIEPVTITDLSKQLDIGLADHPLYTELQRYVKDNPR